MCITEITENNIFLLKDFLNNKLPNTFRYFNKRTIDVIVNHIITIIFLYNELPIGYAHIDYDGTKYWFGICILDKYQGNGYGNKMMEYIINHEKIKKINKIYLTVDKINNIAIKLYKKFNFYINENDDNEKQSYYIMCSDNL
jgi:ribosomal protein S18 acetylase RimI-like enzyme